VIERLRKRDLFAFAGEVILQPQVLAEMVQRRQQKADSTLREDIGELAKREMLSLSNHSELNEADLFCVPVKIGYGKGQAGHPVSDCTTFYQPRKGGGDEIGGEKATVLANRGTRPIVIDQYIVGLLPGGTVP
jgi:hypothetical protein